MFAKTYSFAGLLVLAGALVFMTPASSQAQRRGGAHLGAGRVGGFHAAAYRGGFQNNYRHYGSALHYGYHYPHQSGFQHNYPYSGGYGYAPYYGGYGYSPYYGGYGYSPYYGGYGYSPYYGGYGYSPYYGGYGYFPNNYGTTPYFWSAPGYDPGNYNAYVYGGLLPPYVNSSTGAPQPPYQSGTYARVTVNAPASAEVWLNDTKLISTGTVREYLSPPLQPGNQYTYQIHRRCSRVTSTATRSEPAGMRMGSR
jgi:uncharacterized protein (TIGR03000 family)